MPRFVFVFVIASAALCFATKESHAQDAGIIKAADTASEDSTPVSQLESGTTENKSESGPSSEPVLKKTPSLLEEFFSSPLNYFLVLVVCLYIYLMFIQPRSARNEKQSQLLRLNHLKKNDRVVTTAGIHGIVSNINTDAGTVTLRVDENSNAKLTIDRNSIRSVAS
ncbi:MAG: preprotein translocase subunit YajC [Planctomycetota bacterium]|jgi:preprotein translocase subunit YajC|nr:preprotein translocase subunit YajC [Planctomycetota bacterium]